MITSPDVLDLVSAVALAIALSACSGLRALLPILLTGVVTRLGWLSLGPAFDFLGTDRALLIFGLAAVLEMAGDKIPALDHALDVLHTVLRPLSGSLLAAAALSRVSEPTTAMVVGIVLGAPTALVPHVARSGVRVASTVFTAGLANPLISVVEDVAVIVFFVAAVLLPLLAALVAIVVLILLLRMGRSRRLSPAPLPAAK